jgi:hypothetical protein
MLVIDGRPVRSYMPLSLQDGHVVGTVEPYLTRVAQRVELAGGYLILTRGTHRIRVPIGAGSTGPGQTQVALVPLLRALGEDVAIDGARGRIEVTSPRHVAIATPAPFDPRAPQVAASIVFTPTPVPTPALTWSGTPVPRRTPIPREAWATPKPPR